MRLTGREALDCFQDLRLGGSIIIEHRPENENIVGRIEYSGVNGGGQSFGVGWHHVDGGNRTTVFYSQLWELQIVDNVIFVKRVKGGRPQDMDMPWDGCILYTIIVGDRR